MRPLYLLCLLGILLALHPLRAQEPITISFFNNELFETIKPFGINIGARNRWGEAQILKNLIDNPGFEAGEMGMVALSDRESTARSFRQAYWYTEWGGQPEGFWDGASYEIVWGEAEGRTGTISRFHHDDGRYVFDLGSEGTVPAEHDVMFVRTTVPGIDGNTAIADPASARPGSPGTQSLRLVAREEQSWNFYMDSEWRDGDRSTGKMLPIVGKWRVSVWAKGSEDARGRIRFFREGEATFLDSTVDLTGEWQRFEWDLDVAPGVDPVRKYANDEYHPILGFRLEAIEGTVWFDDVAVERADENPTVFTDLFVQRLKELRPGILRNWSNQLGASLDNQLAPTFGRRTHGYKPGEGADAWAFSLHEFLELCAEVEAEPWYVIPPTFSRNDLLNLMEYLDAPADARHPYALLREAQGREEAWTRRFRKIHLEFGNELWGSGEAGDPFQGASVRGGDRLGSIAADRFAIMRSSPLYDTRLFHEIVGGQAGYPERQREITRRAKHTVALAPYFGILDTWENDSEIFGPLLAHPTWEVSERGRMHESYNYLREELFGNRLAIYEINFHTTGGAAPIDVRNDFVTSAAGGLALPLAMLKYLVEFGAIDQAAFSALGHSFRMPNGEYVRLWGMLRDLYATGRKRPTWLGLEMINLALNQVHPDALNNMALGTEASQPLPFRMQGPINGIGGEIAVPTIESFAFRSRIHPAGFDRRYSVILFNLDLDSARSVKLRARDTYHEGRDNYIDAVTHYRLAPGSIHDDNEDAVMFSIDSIDLSTTNASSDLVEEGLLLDLPPSSLHVITWALRMPDDVPHEAPEAGDHLFVPNPARAGDHLSVALATSGNALVELIDPTGRTVARIAEEEMSEGGHVLRLPEGLVSGTYFIRLSIDGVIADVRKVLLVE